MAFSSVSSILSKNYQKAGGLSRQITASLICEEFDKIISKQWGSALSDQARALYFKDKILTIACLSSVFAQEIKLHEDHILKQLNYKFNGIVSRIKYLL